MSAFLRAQIREIRPEERILRCSAHKGLSKRNGYRRKITCEKPALHGFGCSIDPASDTEKLVPGANFVLKREAQRHAGRDTSGRWHFWKDGE